MPSPAAARTPACSAPTAASTSPRARRSAAGSPRRQAPAVDPARHAQRQGRDRRHRGGRREVRRAQRPDLRRPTAGSISPIPATGTRRPSRIPAASSSSRRTARPRILEELDHVYPNGIVAEPDGSIVWVESYTLRVVRRQPDGTQEGDLHTCRRATSPTASRSTPTAISGSPPSPPAASTSSPRTASADRFPRDRRHVPSTASSARAASSICCDMGPFDTTGAAAMTGRLLEGRCRRRRHAALPRRDRLRPAHEDRQDRSDPGQLSGAERLQRAPPSVPRQDHGRRRPGRLGRVDHPVPRGELRGQGDHRGHGAESDRQGPGPDRGALAAEQAAGLVVRLRRRHRLLRHRGDRHRALGPEGQGARPQRARPARRAGARAAAGDRLLPRALRVDPGDGRGDRGMGLDRPAGPEDRLRQARQCPPRLRARPRRRVCQGDARGARRQAC